jgi:hypothetical protein
LAFEVLRGSNGQLSFSPERKASSYNLALGGVLNQGDQSVHAEPQAQGNEVKVTRTVSIGSVPDDLCTLCRDALEKALLPELPVV